MTAWYEESFSREYLALYPHRDDSEAAADVAQILALLAPPKSEPLLDLACGAGRHLIALWNAGYRQLVGLDLSQDLLDEARQRLDREGIRGVELVRGDMRSIPYSERFGTVLSMFTSFGYFADPGDDDRVLRNVCYALHSGGLLLIDTLSRGATIASLVQEEEKQIGGRRLRIRRFVTEDGQRVEKETQIVDDSGSRTYRESVRMYSPEALTDALIRSGFTRVVCYGSLAGEPYTEDSPRLVAVARKGAS